MNSAAQILGATIVITMSPNSERKGKRGEIMKTLKNKLFLVFAAFLAISVTAFAVANLSVNYKKAYAADVNSHDFTAGEWYNFDLSAPIECDSVSFEYKITSGDHIDIYVGEASGDIWNNGYGRFRFTSSGISTGSCDAVTVTDSSDGFKLVTIILDGSKTVTQTGTPPAKVKRLAIRGNWSNAAGTIKNIIFKERVDLSTVISMVEGASVRLSEPYGIRFKANVSEAVVGDPDYSFGMTIIPYDWVINYSEYVDAADGDYVAALDGAGVNYRKFDCEPVSNGDGYYIQASLTNIKEKNLDREFIGIAWVEKGGVKTYAYNEKCARSIRTVSARAYIKAENDGVDYTDAQDEFLLGMMNTVSRTDSNVTVELKTTCNGKTATKGEEVIEFYYKRNSAGVIKFAVLGTKEGEGSDWSWQNFYGYYTITDDNLTNDIGVQIMPAGDNWNYTGNSTDAIQGAANLWYKVVIDPSQLCVVAGGDPSGIIEFDKLFFNYCDATFDIAGFNVRPRTVDDGCYYVRGKNGNPYRTLSGTSVDLTDKSELTFYFKQVSDKGTQDGQKRLRLYFNIGSNGEYVNFFTHLGLTDKTFASFATVTDGEYAGWYKATIDLTGIPHSGTLTAIYNWYTRGEFLLGGFSAN